MKRAVLALILFGSACSVSIIALQLTTPTDWKWRTDNPAAVTNNSATLPPEQWYYVGMPPGWHVTTNPGVLLYHPGHDGRGNFTLESEVFLFPGDNQEEYGLFIGGKSLDPTASAPSYTAFLIRRDGQAAILKRNGASTTALVNWKTNTVVAPHPGGDVTARNVLKVEVGPANVLFYANGTEIARVPRNEVTAEGAFGFRLGKSLNLHITSLDFTQRLAPTRP